MRRLVLGAGFALVMSGQVALAQSSVLVSGQTTLATIDTDGNGPDSSDCIFTGTPGATMGTNPIQRDLTFFASQQNTPLLRVCNGLSFFAFASKGANSSSNYVSAYIYEADGPMGFDYPGSLPFVAQLVDETNNPDIDDPVGVNEARDYGQFDDESQNRSAFGALCNAGGPAASLRIAGSPNLLVQLELYPNANSPTHLKTPGPPGVFQLNSGGFQAFDSYIPVTPNGHITMATTDAPNSLLMDINLAMLPPCGAIGGVFGTPTLAESGLMALALSLLLIGVRMIARRPEFARSIARC